MEDFKHFNFWCYKVLPLVYDDSLSYYEVLCKVVKYINELIDEDKLIYGEIDKLKAELAIVIKFIEDFDTEVAERIIREALANLASVLFTSTITDEDASDSINTAIEDGAKIIIVDSDIYINKNVVPKSGVSFVGAGGKIRMGTGGHFYSAGTYTDITTCDTIVTGGAMYVDVASASGIEVGKRYKIRGSENLFDKETVGANNWLGSGTASMQSVYGGFEFTVKSISGTRIYLDRPAPYYVGACSFFTIDELENATFKDLIIEGTNRIFNIRRGNNIHIDNCNISVTGEANGSYPIYLFEVYDSEITNCTIINYAGGSSSDNSIVTAGAGELKIIGNKIVGGYQAIDISYHTLYSFNNLISENTIFGCAEQALTTHPACFGNIISNNKFGNDISIRSKSNHIMNNTISGQISINHRCIDDCVISGNCVWSLYPIRISYSSDGTEPYEKIYITDNIFPRITAIMSGIISSGDTDQSSLTIIFDGNVIGSGAQPFTWLTDFVTEDTSEKAPIAKLIVNNNTFNDLQRLYLFGASVAINTVVFNNNTILASKLGFCYTKHGDSYTVIANVIRFYCNGNNGYFTEDMISNVSHYNTGANYPAHPIKGDTFLKDDGTYAIYDGSNWREIAIT